MVNRSKSFISILFLLITLIFSSAVMAQSFSIDPNDGVVDSAWNTVPAILKDDYEYDEDGNPEQYGDIVNAWFVYDQSDPLRLYFRVDGYDIVDFVSFKIDCDADDKFESEVDREIVFFGFDDDGASGEVEVEIKYTDEYLDANDDADFLDSFLFGDSEFIVLDEETNFQSIEAVLSFAPSDNYKISDLLPEGYQVGDTLPKFGDSLADMYEVMAPCFLNEEENVNWSLAYIYDTGNDSTDFFPQDIRTAVSLSQQSADSKHFSPILWASFASLLALTISLLFGYSYRQRKNV
ncbi:MAG: hypothetical protein AB8G95_04995 [Anaerolineae bacterium]